MEMMKINEGQRGTGGQLPEVSVVDAISISNQMANHRSAVSVCCRVHNVGSTCNAGGSSSLHKRMNAAARLMQPLRCAATVNGPENQPAFAAARVKHKAHASTGTTGASHITARAQLVQWSSTCTLLMRPRVTRSITTSAQPRDVNAKCTLAGAVASRWHAIATQGNMRRTRIHVRYSAKMEPRSGSAAWRRCLQRGDRCAKKCASEMMSSSGRKICARSCAGDSSLPSATRASDSGLPARSSVNEREMVDLEEEGDRGIVDSEVQDENFAPIRLQEGDFAKRKPLRIWLKKELGGGGGAGGLKM
jgi:hypothetical protein